jgi:hypothetical protein
MTIEHAPSTNGRVHTDDVAPSEPRTYEAREQRVETGGGIRKLIMPVVLMVVALFVLRRLNKGNVV